MRPERELPQKCSNDFATGLRSFLSSKYGMGNRVRVASIYLIKKEAIAVIFSTNF